MSESPYTLEALKARYEALCKQRDEANAKAAPHRAEMEKCANESEKWRVKAMEAKAKIDEIRGGHNAWFDLKKEIGLIAKLMQGRK